MFCLEIWNLGFWLRLWDLDWIGWYGRKVGLLLDIPLLSFCACVTDDRGRRRGIERNLSRGDDGVEGGREG